MDGSVAVPSQPAKLSQLCAAAAAAHVAAALAGGARSTGPTVERIELYSKMME